MTQELEYKLDDKRVIKNVLTDIPEQSKIKAIRKALNHLFGNVADAAVSGEIAKLAGVVVETKANKEKGLTADSSETRKAKIQAFRESNPDKVAELEEQTISAAWDDLMSGKWAEEPERAVQRAAKTPVETMAFELARNAFDSILKAAGVALPVAKNGGRLAPNAKAMAGIKLNTSKGELAYPDALQAFYDARKDQAIDGIGNFVGEAKRVLDRDAKKTANVQTGATINI